MLRSAAALCDLSVIPNANQRLRECPASVQTSLMQHEVFANTEDFGGPDIVAGPARVCRPGMDPPYANYSLGKPYDEMFTRDGNVRPSYAALDSRLSTLQLEELNRRQQPCEQSFLHQASLSPSTTTTRRRNGSSPPIFCRASSPPRNGTVS